MCSFKFVLFCTPLINPKVGQLSGGLNINDYTWMQGNAVVPVNIKSHFHYYNANVNAIYQRKLMGKFMDGPPVAVSSRSIYQFYFSLGSFALKFD